MEKKLKILTMIILILGYGEIYAQFTGPNSKPKYHTVKEIKANAYQLDRSDALVKVKGHIIKQVNKDSYEFKDNTGVISVDISNKKLPAREFDETTELILIGEVDYDMFEPVEIEVKEVIFVEPKQ